MSVYLTILSIYICTYIRIYVYTYIYIYIMNSVLNATDQHDYDYWLKK